MLIFFLSGNFFRSMKKIEDEHFCSKTLFIKLETQHIYLLLVCSLFLNVEIALHCT